MKRKRLFIIFWSLGIGGVQKRIKDICIEISEHSPHVDIYIFLRRKTDSGFDRLMPKNKRVHIIYYKQHFVFRFPLEFIFFLFFQYISLRPHVVLTFLDQLSVTMVIIKKICFWQQTKLVLNEGIYTSTYLTINRHPVWKSLVKLFYKYADVIIVPTRACMSDLIDHFDVPSRIITVIPNWTMMVPTSPLKSIWDVIYVGRFEGEKNPELMIELVKQMKVKVPSFKCILIGSGSLKDTLIREINDFGLRNNITLVDFSLHISSYYRQSKIALVPSVNEGMPNVVLEAGICGIPVVVNDFFGANEVVQDKKTGIIVHSFDEMVGAVEQLLANPTKRLSFGRAAQKFITHHHSLATQKRFVKTLLE